MTWKTINKEKLERAIDERSAAIDALAKGKERTANAEEAYALGILTAEHNALVVVFDCLE